MGTQYYYVGDNRDDGLMLGYNSSDKIGAYGTTPVAQRANASQAEATDAATVITLANELRAALVALGFVKGSA